jgi:hypothetical protein
MDEESVAMVYRDRDRVEVGMYGHAWHIPNQLVCIPFLRFKIGERERVGKEC